MTNDPVIIPRWFQGPTDSGQGGWTAHRFTERIGVPVTTAIRAPIPLDRELVVERGDDVIGDDGDASDGEWLLVDRNQDRPVTVMTARSWEPDFPDTAPVSPSEAAGARRRFRQLIDDHPVPYCFSCGTQHDSMNVHAGPLGDGRFATDWRVPDWAVAADGVVDLGTVWAAIDCTAAWYIGYSRGRRIAVTAQYAVEVTGPIEPDTTYALVGWSGDHDPEWDGRKRHGASAAFAPDGTCVARSVSFWIAVDL